MKRLFFINDTVANKVSYYHLACFLVALPFDFFYSEIILVSFGLHTLLHTSTAKWKEIFDKAVLIPVSIYLLGLVAIVYSPDKPEAFNIATRQLAILLFPLLFVLTDLNLKKYKLDLICIFGFTCTVIIIYLYADAINTLYYFHLPVSLLFSKMFMNHNFSIPIEMHATYLSLYTAFSLLGFIYLALENKQPGQKWIYIVAIFVLSAGLLQLSSRAVFIAFVLIVNLVFPFLLFTGRKRKIFFLTASILSAAVLLVITEVDSFKTRYISELKTDLTENVRIIDNTEPRLARWNAIMELVNRSPVIGYGSGSEKKLLKEKYFEKGLYNSYLNEFNTHSEYLSILVKTGIIGLALFIYVLYFGVASAFKQKDILFLSFMLMIAVVSVSENMLDLNKGIFFYSFFFSLFLWDKRVYKMKQSRDLSEDKATTEDYYSIKNIEKETSDASPVSSYNHVQ